MSVTKKVNNKNTTLNMLNVFKVNHMWRFASFGTKYEKHSWRSVTFSNVTGFPPLWVFFMFFKLCKWYQIAQRVSYSRLNHFTNNTHFEQVQDSNLVFLLMTLNMQTPAWTWKNISWQNWNIYSRQFGFL